MPGLAWISQDDFLSSRQDVNLVPRVPSHSYPPSQYLADFFVTKYVDSTEKTKHATTVVPATIISPSYTPGRGAYETEHRSFHDKQRSWGQLVSPSHRDPRSLLFSTLFNSFQLVRGFFYVPFTFYMWMDERDKANGGDKYLWKLVHHMKCIKTIK